MKTTILFLALLSTITCYSQIQLGADIDGEAEYDESGEAISLSSNGDIVAIGAPRNAGNGNNSGHVRVYKNLSGTWTQIGQDIDGEAEEDHSGQSVSLSSDGSILAIGADENDGSFFNSGHVRVYQNISGTWTQIGDDIDGEALNDNSGFSVSLSSDGSIVAIGARFNDGNGEDSGHVRVYENISGTWTQIGADIDGEAAGDRLGYSVSLSSDGSVVAVGSRQNNGTGPESGHVRVYENISGTWTQIGDDIDGEATEDNSGSSISLSSDGNILAIGAYSNDGNGEDSGHVRVYENLSGTWTQIGADIDGEAADDRLGSTSAVSLSSDGSILAVGADNNSGNGLESGHVRIYQNVAGVWTQIGVDIDGEAIEDNSGSGVRLSSDGSIVAIGANANDGNGEDSGHVRIYNLSTLLSIEDNEISKNIMVYPNPVNDYVHLQLPTTLEFKKANIYNNIGQLVLQSETTIINVRNLSSGSYYLEVETDNGKGVKTIIKQ